MISFIIPTYNEEKAIGETLKRIKGQYTLTPYEIIVADDQSTDKTVEIAKTLADKVVVMDKKISIAANRNNGAKEARYPFLVFMDSGVTIPDLNAFFKKAFQIFEARPRLAGLVGNINIHPATNADRFFTWIVNLWFALNINVLGLGFANGKLQMIRASVFREAGGYNEKLVAGEDSELFNRLSKTYETRWEKSLQVFHSGRREHALGWPKVLLLWMGNGLSMIFFKKALSKEWKAIR